MLADDSTTTADLYSNIGGCYYDMKIVDSTQKYFEQAKANSPVAGDCSFVAAMDNNLAECASHSSII